MKLYMNIILLVFTVFTASASFATPPRNPIAKVASKKIKRKAKIKEAVTNIHLNETQTRVVSEIREAAFEFGIPEKFLVGICKTESNFDHKAFVYNDGGDAINPNHAIGTCQVLLKTAQEFADFSLKGCEKDFRNKNLIRSEKSCKLFSPKQNARVAAKYLKHQLKRYPRRDHAIAAYNSGSIKMCSDAGLAFSKNHQVLYSCVPGKLMNEEYVRRVYKAAAQFVQAQKDSLVVSPLNIERSLTSNQMQDGKSQKGA